VLDVLRGGDDSGAQDLGLGILFQQLLALFEDPSIRCTSSGPRWHSSSKILSSRADLLAGDLQVLLQSALEILVRSGRGPGLSPRLLEDRT
jgi:hypothetical protein